MNSEEERKRKREIFMQWLDEVFKAKMLLPKEEIIPCDALRVRWSDYGKKMEVSAQGVPDLWYPFSNTKELREILRGFPPEAPKK